MKKMLLFTITIIFTYILNSLPCSAQIIEFYGVVQQIKGDQTMLDDAPLEVNNSTGGGFGAGFNLSHINMNIDFIFGSTKITWKDRELDSKLFLFNANLDYVVLKKSLTPFVTIGLGSVNFSDSFVQVETLSETDFSYNLGVGIKLIAFDHFIVKGLYKATWTKIKETDGNIKLDGACINFGYVL